MMRKRYVMTMALVLVTLLAFGCSGSKPAATPAAPSQASGTSETKPAPAPAKPKIEYPKGNINVLIGYAPGGGSDTMLSAVRPGMEQLMKTTLVPVYKPGSGSDIALTEVAKAKPDGYTVVVSTTPQIYINPVVRKTEYQFSDFQLVANVVTDPGILVVRADGPLKSFDDLLKRAKAEPGKVSVGVSSAPSDDWFAAIMLEQGAKIDLNIVVFSGDGPSWQAALGGQIDVSANNLGIVYPQVAAGKLRALAVMSDKRSPYLPDVPTLKELGYDIQTGSSRGFAMPKETPREVVDAFANSVKQVMESPEFLAKAKEIAFPMDFRGPDDFTAFLNKQQVTYKELWEKFGKEAQEAK